jgi:uncharacterized protein
MPRGTRTRGERAASPTAIPTPRTEWPPVRAESFCCARSYPNEMGRPQFMLRLSPCRGHGLLLNPTPQERTIIAAHLVYVTMLADRGQLVFTGMSEGAATMDTVLVVETDSEEEARQLMANDPFVVAGLVRAELEPFRGACRERQS